MAIDLSMSGKLIIKDGTKILFLNRQRIEQLNNDNYYSNSSMNKYGRLLAYYICNVSYGDLYNNDPVNLMKNSLHKVLARIKVIDNYVKKPLEEYTKEDLTAFMADFREGNISKADNGKHEFKKTTLPFYIREFKRLWKVFRQYQVQNGTNFNPVKYEWGLLIRSPKIDKKQTYEKFLDMDITHVIDLANSMYKEEYKVRVLMSVNLMGRKCEMNFIRRRMVEEKSGGRIWVKLPEIKKNSSEKTEVELWTFVKRALMPYLKHYNFRDDDYIFPSNDPAFAKNLREMSEKLFKHRINPKTLRKIGVSVAEKLGYDRADVERIGGWAANSEVLNHYFQRRPVAVMKKSDNLVEKSLHSEIYTELERLKQEREKQQKAEMEKDKELKELKEKMDKFEKVNIFMNHLIQHDPSLIETLTEKARASKFNIGKA